MEVDNVHALRVADAIVPPLFIVLPIFPDVGKRIFQPLYEFAMLRSFFNPHILQNPFIMSSQTSPLYDFHSVQWHLERATGKEALERVKFGLLLIGSEINQGNKRNRFKHVAILFLSAYIGFLIRISVERLLQVEQNCESKTCVNVDRVNYFVENFADHLYLIHSYSLIREFEE